MQKQQRFIPDQRFDLPQFKSMMDLLSAEFRSYNRAMLSPNNWIFGNWKIEAQSGLTVRVNNGTDSLLMNSERVGKESLNYRALSMVYLTKALEDNAVNYVEVEINTSTTAADSVAIWNTAADAGAGAEFIQASDTVQCEEPRLVNRIDGTFTVGQANRLPLAIVTTAGGVITSIVDGRRLFFKQQVDWSFGIARNGIGGPYTDSTIGTFKDNDTALKTILKEIKGTTNWYDEQTLNVAGILERMNYILVDGGNISWNLEKAASGRIVASVGEPTAGIADGDAFTISDGVTSVIFEFDTNSSVIGGHVPVTITQFGTVVAIRAAIIAAINGHAFNVTASAGADPASINLVNDNLGAAGNVAISESFANAGVSLWPEGMSGGFTTPDLTWAAALRIIAPSRAFAYTISAQTVANLADGEVAYVTLPTEGVAPGGPLSVTKVTSSAYVISATAHRNYILAYRSGSRIYFGNGWQSVELEDGETNQLGDGITSEWLTATGLTSEFDSTPPYTSSFWVSPGASFTRAISQLDLQVEAIWNLIGGTVYEEEVTSDASAPFLNATNATIVPLPLPPKDGIGPAYTYQAGFHQLGLFVNGQRLRQGPGKDWVEDANLGSGVGNRVILSIDIPLGSVVQFLITLGGGQTGGVGSDAPDVYDEGLLVASQVGKFNFIGPEVTVTSPAVNEVDITFKYPRELGKLVKNATGSSIAANKALAWLDNGTVALFDANVSTLSDFAGISAQIIPNNAFGTAVKAGACAGAVTGMGAIVGQAIYASGTPGDLTLTAPTGLTDTVIRLGRAEPADGVASATATDLWLDPEVIAEP